MVAHAHTAESESRNFQAAFSKFALLHFMNGLSFVNSARVLTEMLLRGGNEND